MLIIGLTGSIGMGKSTAAEQFRKRGIPVFNADAEVHRLYEEDAVAAISDAFPGSVREGRVDRDILARTVLTEEDALTRLEAIVHPLVRASERDFLLEQADAGAALAVLEIPLLFETGADRLVDISIVVSASAKTQRERVLARAGMTLDKLEAVRAKQLPDQDKRKRANFVVDTDRAIGSTAAEIDTIIESLKAREGRAMDRWRDL